MSNSLHSVEVVLDLWIDDDEVEEAALLGEVLELQGGDDDRGCPPSTDGRLGKLPPGGMLGALGTSPWLPDMPSLPPSLASPLQWVDAIPVTWLCEGGRRARIENYEQVDATLSKQSGGTDSRRGSWLQPSQPSHAATLPAMATISWVSSVCVYAPRQTPVSMQLSLAGNNLCSSDCEVLGRSSSTASYHVEKHQLVTKAASVQVTVHGVTSPSVLLLEARMNQLLSRSRVVLLVDCEAMARELEQLGEQLGEQRSAEANEELLRDLGSWLEYSLERSLEPSPQPPLTSVLPSNPEPTAQPLVQALQAQDAAAAPAAAAVASALHAREPIPQDSILSESRPGSLHIPSSRTRAPGYHNKLLSLGFHVLEHAVEVGWCAVSMRIVKEMMEIHGLSICTIFQRATSGGASLLHRAIRSYNIQMLHTVLRWGDMYGYEWGLDRLVPAKTRKGRQVQVSALHMAAALGDSGYAGELLLLKFAKARQFWRRIRDSQGFLPCHYATFAGNGHLDMMASRPGSPSEPSLPGEQQDMQPDLPRLPEFPRTPPPRAKGKRVPRTPGGISRIGMFLDQATLTATLMDEPFASPSRDMETESEPEWLSPEVMEAMEAAMELAEGRRRDVGQLQPTPRAFAPRASPVMADSGDAAEGEGEAADRRGEGVDWQDAEDEGYGQGAAEPEDAESTAGSGAADPPAALGSSPIGKSGVLQAAASVAAMAASAVAAAAAAPSLVEQRLLEFLELRWAPFTLLWLLAQLLLGTLAGLQSLLASSGAADFPGPAAGLQLLPTVTMLAISYPQSCTSLKRCFLAAFVACIILRSLGTGWGWMPSMASMCWPFLGAVYWISPAGVEKVSLPITFLCLVLDIAPDGVDISQVWSLTPSWSAPVFTLTLKTALAVAVHHIVQRQKQTVALGS